MDSEQPDWRRSATAVLGGIVLSMVLATLAGVVLTRTSEMQVFFNAMQGARTGQDPPQGEAERVLAAMDVTAFRMRWIAGPAVAVLTGAFVRLIARAHVWQMAILAVMPFAYLFSGGWISRSSVMFSALYVGLAASVAGLVSSASRRQTADPFRRR